MNNHRREEEELRWARAWEVGSVGEYPLLFQRFARVPNPQPMHLRKKKATRASIVALEAANGGEEGKSFPRRGTLSRRTTVLLQRSRNEANEMEMMLSDERDVKAAFAIIDQRCESERASMDGEYQLTVEFLSALAKREAAEAEERSQMAFVENMQRKYEEQAEIERKEREARERRERLERVRATAECRQMGLEETAQRRMERNQAREREDMAAQDSFSRQVFEQLAALRKREVKKMSENERFQKDVFDVVDQKIQRFSKRLRNRQALGCFLSWIDFVEWRQSSCALMVRVLNRIVSSNMIAGFDTWVLFTEVARDMALETADMAAEEEEQRKVFSALDAQRQTERNLMFVEEEEQRKVFSALDAQRQTERNLMFEDEATAHRIFRILDNRRLGERGRMAQNEESSRSSWAAIDDRRHKESLIMSIEDMASLATVTADGRKEAAEKEALEAEKRRLRLLESSQLEQTQIVSENSAMKVEDSYSTDRKSEWAHELYECDRMAAEDDQCHQPPEDLVAALRETLASLRQLQALPARSNTVLVRKNALLHSSTMTQMPSFDVMTAAVAEHFPSSEKRGEAMELEISRLIERSKPLEDGHIQGLLHRTSDLEEQLNSLRKFAPVVQGRLNSVQLKRDNARHQKKRAVQRFLALRGFCEKQRRLSSATDAEPAVERNSLEPSHEEKIEAEPKVQLKGRPSNFRREEAARKAQLDIEISSLKRRMAAAVAIQENCPSTGSEEKAMQMSKVFWLWEAHGVPFQERRAFLKTVEAMSFSKAPDTTPYHDKTIQLQQRVILLQLSRKVEAARVQLSAINTALQSPHVIVSEKAVKSLKDAGIKIHADHEADSKLMISYLSSLRIILSATTTQQNRALLAFTAENFD